jgi:hypothetical protein
MAGPEFETDGQDQAEVYDETHLDDEGDGDLSFDEADDVLDVTQMDGDSDAEPFDEDDADLDADLALDGIEAEADALLGVNGVRLNETDGDGATTLRRHPRPDAGGQRRRRAAAPAADQGRAGHRQDPARRGSRRALEPAALPVAHQIDDQGAAGPLRIRRRLPPARLAARRPARRRHQPLHRQWRAVAGLRVRARRRSC